MKKIAKPRTIVNSSAPEGSRYDARELALPTHRPGCNDHFKYPSRMSNELRYRDGTIQRIPTENDLAEQAIELSQGGGR